MSKFFASLTALFYIGFCSCSKADPIELSTLNEIVTIMGKHYYDESFHGLKWQEMVESTKTKIKEASSSEERYGYITALLKSLKHSHLEFVPPTARKEKGPNIPSGTPKEINFEIEKFEEKWVVTKVVPESDAAKAGLKAGMEVEKVNQWNTAELYAEEKVMGYYRMRHMLQTFPKRKISLKVKGKEELISWSLSPYKGKFETLGYITDAAEFEKKILPGNIGYIRFSIFLVGPAKQVIQAIKEFRDKECPGIIIDIRNNPGGVAMMAPAITKEFCQKNYNLGTQKGRESTLKFPVFKQPKPYKGKVILLINRTSASTSEILAAGVQEEGTAYVIGENSAGMALPSVMVTLKDGSIFQYPVADFKTVSGKTIEGIGAVPDLKVSHTLKSLSEGRDLFIEKAVEFIKSEN